MASAAPTSKLWTLAHASLSLATQSSCCVIASRHSQPSIAPHWSDLEIVLLFPAAWSPAAHSMCETVATQVAGVEAMAGESSTAGAPGCIGVYVQPPTIPHSGCGVWPQIVVMKLLSIADGRPCVVAQYSTLLEKQPACETDLAGFSAVYVHVPAPAAWHACCLVPATASGAASITPLHASRSVAAQLSSMMAGFISSGSAQSVSAQAQCPFCCGTVAHSWFSTRPPRLQNSSF